MILISCSERKETKEETNEYLRKNKGKSLNVSGFQYYILSEASDILLSQP